MKFPERAPTDAAVKWARQQEKHGDREKVNGFHNFSERRWIGFLGEWAFYCWLRDHGVPFKYNQHDHRLPDFEIGGRGIGVKTCGARHPFTEHHTVNVFDRHREQSPPELVFVGHVGLSKPTAMVLLGAHERQMYFERARLVLKGDLINPVTVAENDVWNLTVGELQPITDWLRSLRGRLSSY